MIFLSLRVIADAEGGLKNRAHLRPVLQGFGGGQPPTSTRRVYTGALLAAFLYPSFFVVTCLKSGNHVYWSKLFCWERRCGDAHCHL